MEQPKKIRRPRGKAALIPNACIACGARCQSSCPTDAITMNDKGEPIIDTKTCIGCQQCVKVCPAQALELYFTPEELKIIAELDDASSTQAEDQAEQLTPEEIELNAYLDGFRGVWVFVEQTDGTAAKVAWELLGAGAKLASSLDVELCAIVLGDGVENLCQEAFRFGATKAYLIDDPLLRHYRTKPYAEGICALVDRYKPEIVLMGATGLGRDLAGAVATHLKTGLTADCTGLDVDEKRQLLQTRPAFGGNIMATIFCEKRRPQMASVRPHVMPMPCRDEKASGEIVRESINLTEADIPTKVLEVILDANQADDQDIGEAEFIISGGRGLLDKQNFQLLRELADELGGVVGSSRSAVDAGWIDVEHQVGQTGKTVRPKVYIACGISGAIQHLVGMQDADLIIAINRDPEAPIFEIADYGIVGDLFEIVPAITKSIRRAKAAQDQQSHSL